MWRRWRYALTLITSKMYKIERSHIHQFINRWLNEKQTECQTYLLALMDQLFLYCVPMQFAIQQPLRSSRFASLKDGDSVRRTISYLIAGRHFVYSIWSQWLFNEFIWFKRPEIYSHVIWMCKCVSTKNGLTLVMINIVNTVAVVVASSRHQTQPVENVI